MLFLRTPQTKWRRQTNYQDNVKQTDALQGELHMIFESLFPCWLQSFVS